MRRAGDADEMAGVSPLPRQRRRRLHHRADDLRRRRPHPVPELRDAVVVGVTTEHGGLAFGEADELGMLNHVDERKRREALALVREGRLYDLGRVLDESVPVFPGRYFRQTLVTTAHHDNGGGVGDNGVNWITEQVAGTMQLGHAPRRAQPSADRRPRLQRLVGRRARRTSRASRRLGVETIPQIVTRGWLVDVAGHRPRRRHRRRRPGRASTPQPGDAVLFHTGLGRDTGTTPTPTSRASPGPGLDVAAWLAERGVALTGCDTWSYGPVPAEDPARPFEVPQTLNVRHGVFIVENLDTAALAADGVREFALSSPTPGSAAPPAPGPSRSPSSDWRDRDGDHYDVIIIGTGRGRRHAGAPARPVRASGSSCSNAAATCLASPRTGTPTRCSARTATSPARRGTTSDGAPFTPHAAVLRRRQHEVLRRDPVPPARARLRRGPPLRRRLPGVAARRTPTSSRTTPRRSSSTSCTAQQGEDPTEPPALRPVPASGGLARAAHPAARTTTSRGRATARSTCPVGVDLDESDPEAGAACAATASTASRASPTARPTRTCSASARRSKHPNVTLRTHARVERLETDAAGTSVTGVVVDRRGARGALQRGRRRRLLRRGQLGGAAAALGPTAPERAGQLLRRRRPQLHGPHQLGRDRDLADAEHDEASRRRSASTTTTGAPTTPSFRSGTSRCSASPTGNILRAGAPWFAPGLALDYMAKHAIDFWLTTEDLPHPDNRVTVDRQGSIHLAKHLLQRRGAQAAAAQAQGPARRAGLPGARDPRLVGARPADPAGGRRAPVRDGALRRRPRDVGARRRTARRTTSTTSTSSTRASSRRRAR